MKKYKINTLFWVFLLFSLINGCVNPDDERNQWSGTGNKFNIQFMLPEGTLKTRSVPAEAGENTVSDLTLLFFTPSSNATGTYVGYYRVPEEDFGLVDTNSFNFEVKFESGSGMSVTSAYSILAFANMKDNYLSNLDQEFDDYITLISSMKEQDVKNYTIMNVEGVGTDQNNDLKAMPRTNLPMSASFSKEEKQENVVCDLTRAVSRFDVVNGVSSYTLVSASIWNAYPQGAVWDTRSLGYSDRRLKRYYGIKLKDQDQNPEITEIKGGLYAFENVSTTPDMKDEVTTCLILGFKPSGADDEEVTYYRVNISPQVTGQYLLRNNVYQVTVSGINGEGAGSEEDAYTNGKMLLDVSINAWDRDEDGLIIRDGDNLLAIPSRRVSFGPEGETRQYYVYTQGIGQLELEIIELPTGIIAWLAGNGNDLFIKADPYTLNERKGAIELRFAGMKGIMEIVQTGQLKKHLTLDHVYVDEYPGELTLQNMIGLNPIQVSSSGPWTAEIYNGNFAFNTDGSKITLEGGNGDIINTIYNLSVNTQEKARTSFVLVSLNEDPDHYRNVIVLRQAGSGKFTLHPNNEAVKFKADGTLVIESNNTNVFELTTDPLLSWEIELLDNNPVAFAFEFNEGNYSGNTCTGDGKFTVKTVGENHTEEVRTATLKISHNDGANTKYITLSQAANSMTLIPTTVDIPAAGGQSKSVTITSSVENGTWSAVITYSNFTNFSGEGPKLVDQDGNVLDQLSGQPLGKTFRVYMPGIDRHLSLIEQPTVEVEVIIDGTSLRETLHVTQQMVDYVNIHAQSIRLGNVTHGLGDWSRGKNSEAYKVFGQWADEMINASNFGPGAEVYTRSVIDISKQSANSIIYTNNIAPRILNMNNIYQNYPGGGDDIDYSNIKKDPNTVMIIYTWLEQQGPFNVLGLGSQFNVDKPTQRGHNVPRKIYQGNQTIKDTKLWEYIFENGPFGTVDPNKVSLSPQAYPLWMNCLTRWPNTMIPLMMVPADNNGNPNPAQLLMGIDPTNRIIWIGHKDLFGNDGISGGSPYPNWNNPDNLTFLKNIIAWMVNVNNYGDAFNDRFKETVD